jgi:predicted ArsR family transcriptional regulator
VAPSEATYERVFETARALGEETRFRIYRQLSLSPDPVSVSELARAFSLHENAIRPHLSRLEQAGLVTSRLHREGGAGRPRRVYWASPELTAFPASHPMRTFVAMLDEAIDALPAEREGLVAFGRAWGRAWARRRRRANGARRSRAARAELLTEELAEWGWEPTSRQDDGVFQVETGRCLFRSTPPGAHGRCCALEEGLLTGLAEGLLNGRPSVVVDGCRFRLEL